MNDYYQCWEEAEDAYRSRPGLWRNLMHAVVYYTHRAWHKEDARWRRTIPGTYVDEIEHMLKWYGFRVLASADLTEGYDSDYRWLIRTPGGRMLILTDGGCSCWEPIQFRDLLMTGYETGRQDIADWVFSRWSSRYDIRLASYHDCCHPRRDAVRINLRIRPESSDLSGCVGKGNKRPQLKRRGVAQW